MVDVVSRFFVGQHVRINAPAYPHHGVETRILKMSQRGVDHGRFFLGAEVDIASQNFPGENCVYEYHELEPILPSGQVAVTLEQLLSVPGLESLDKILRPEIISR